jgi:predicted DsbA family dithiol-disulfide isomerase
MNALHIEIFSDLICPWCYIGKRRMEAGLKLLGEEFMPEIVWRPFQLNPGMPVAGMNRKAYRTKKFGSWERSLAMDAELSAIGKTLGIEFNYDKVLITPNTISGHRLLWWAEQRNQQDAFAEALCKAYFSEGRDVGRHDVLAEIASETGLPKAEAFLQVFSTCLEPTVDPEKDPAVASPQRHRKRSPDCPAGAIPIEAQRPQSLWEAQPEM